MTTIPITSKDIKQHVTLRVKVKVTRLIGPRLILMTKLMRFAAWVGGVGIEITTAGDDK